MDVGLEDRLDGRGVVADDFLLDVKNRDVLRDVDLTKGHGAEESRLSDSIASDETSAAMERTVSERLGGSAQGGILPSMGQSKGGVAENAERPKVDIDVLEVNVLALALVGRRGLERVDLEEELLVALLRLAGVHELRSLVGVLAVTLLHLGHDLSLGLLQRLEVDLSVASLDLFRAVRAM